MFLVNSTIYQKETTQFFIGDNFVYGVWEGIKRAGKAVTEYPSEMAKNIGEGVDKILSAPGKIIEETRAAVEGVLKGVTDVVGGTLEATGKVVTGTGKMTSKGIGIIGKTISIPFAMGGKVLKTGFKIITLQPVEAVKAATEIITTPVTKGTEVFKATLELPGDALRTLGESASIATTKIPEGIKEALGAAAGFGKNNVKILATDVVGGTLQVTFAPAISFFTSSGSTTEASPTAEAEPEPMPTPQPETTPSPEQPETQPGSQPGQQPHA